MKKSVLVITILIVIAIIAVIAGLTFTPKEKEVIKIKVGMLPIADCLQLFVAQEKGFFKEENLEIEAIPMAGGAVIAPAVSSGDIDIGWSNTVSLIVANEKGFDFQILTPGAFRDSSKGAFGNFLIVSDKINTAKDLEGKKFAVNTFGNVNELIIKAWATKNGVDISKVTLIELSFPEMEVALKNNQIDGAIVEEPFATLIVSHNVGKVFDKKPYEVISERVLLASWFAKKSWAEQNKKKLTAFLKAISKANSYILEHPTEIPEILPRHTKLTQELAGQIIVPLFDKEIKKSDLQSVIDASYQYGFITKVFDARDIVVSSLGLK